MFLHNSNGGWEGCCGFEGMCAAGRWGCYLRYVVLASAAASRLLCYLVRGVWPRFLFDASKSRHKLLSESARPDACALRAHWHIPAETSRLVATAGLWRMWTTSLGVPDGSVYSLCKSNIKQKYSVIYAQKVLVLLQNSICMTYCMVLLHNFHYWCFIIATWWGKSQKTSMILLKSSS